MCSFLDNSANSESLNPFKSDIGVTLLNFYRKWQSNGFFLIYLNYALHVVTNNKRHRKRLSTLKTNANSGHPPYLRIFLN